MSTWVLRQWPVPLVAATALIVMLAAQRFGVGVALPAAKADAPAAKLRELPLAFEENRGQTDPQVRFITHGSGYTQFGDPGTQATAVLTINDGAAPPPSPPPSNGTLQLSAATYSAAEGSDPAGHRGRAGRNGEPHDLAARRLRQVSAPSARGRRPV